MRIATAVRRLHERALAVARFNQRRRDAWIAARAATVEPGALLIDVGAGTGRYRHLFRHCRYVALDFAQYEGTASGPLREEFRYASLDCIADVAALPLRSGCADALLCTEVLEHVREPVRALAELLRILRKDGRLLLTAPLASALHQEPHHYYGGFTPHFYRHFVPRLGGEVVALQANQGFFHHLAQEVHRLGITLGEGRRRPRWHPMRLLIEYGLMVLAPLWLHRLARDRPALEEFTVGYHVEAIRA